MLALAQVRSHLQSLGESSQVFDALKSIEKVFLKKSVGESHAELVHFVHEENKPFKCKGCDFICSQRGNLNKHIAKVHERKKLFKCEFF